jgi:hypothetical protein
MTSMTTLVRKTPAADLLSEALRSKLSNPETSPNFDVHHDVNHVPKDVGMTNATW